LCALHGCRLFSDEISNEYASHNFFPSQASLTEKKARFCFPFMISKKVNGVKKSQNFKIWVQKSRIGNPVE